MAAEVTGRMEYSLEAAEAMIHMLDHRNGVADGKLDFDEFRVHCLVTPHTMDILAVILHAWHARG